MAHAQDIGLGIQVTESAIIVIAADVDGTIEHSRMIEGDFAHHSPAETLALAGEVAREAIADCQPAHHVVGVGLATPGLVNSREGYLEYSENLHWSQLSPGPLLGFGGIPVSVANDAKLGALAEWQGSGDPSFIYLTVGTGIGGAIMDEGKLFRGERGWDGEIGHMTVDPRGPLCPCGARGCLEMYASKPALFAAAGLDPAAPILEFITALEDGDAQARAALDTAIVALAQVLSNVITLVDIRHLVIDGELAPLLPWLHGGIERLVDDRVIAGHKVPLTHRRAMAGEFGPALGGALLALLGY
ncbi:MAG: ROK family protein [Promicromonosporaceae bacterium]|nr:ROK family protein [Promicromonosporaceae bacterium]